MNSKPTIQNIKHDLQHVKKFEVVVFGSYATNEFTHRSDIDIAVITRKTDPTANRKIWKQILQKSRQLYHVNIFELMPLHVKANIMDHYLVIFGDHLDISEYFYHFRKLWQDCKHRYYENQFTDFREKIRKMVRA